MPILTNITAQHKTNPVSSGTRALTDEQLSKSSFLKGTDRLPHLPSPYFMSSGIKLDSSEIRMSPGLYAVPHARRHSSQHYGPIGSHRRGCTSIEPNRLTLPKMERAVLRGLACHYSYFEHARRAFV